MNLRSCPREQEVAALVKSGRWPDACEAGLRTHVDTCARCMDLLVVSNAFQRDRFHLMNRAQLPSADLLMWRAQLRRRNSAVERVGRPIKRAQFFALTLNVILAAGLLVFQARQGLNWTVWLAELEHSAAFHAGSLLSSTLLGRNWDLIVLIPTFGVLALLSGVALYLAADKQ